MSGDRSNKNFKTRVTDEDPRLKIWSSWVHEWKRVSHSINKKIERESAEGLMSKIEGQRKIMEDKLLLQYSKIPTYFDKYRGKPDFYKLPDALRDPTGAPKYFSVRTKEQQYIIPEIEQVGVPDVILAEKNIKVEVINMRKMWEASEYRKQQMQKFSEKIKHIIPHRADFSKIGIKGNRIIPIAPKTNEISKEISKDEEIIEQEENNDDAENAEQDTIYINKNVASSEADTTNNTKYILKINDLSFDETINMHCSGSVKLRLNFEYDVSLGKPLVQYITFENNGSAVLRMYWKKNDKPRLFKDLIEDRGYAYSFHFDKKEILLMPFEKIKFPVWFHTNICGYYCETWMIETKPQIWHQDINVCFILQSFAFYPNTKENIGKILNYVDEQVKIILVQDLMREILNEVQYTDNIKPPCVYREAQLFELANFKKGKPQYVYDIEIVEHLKSFYKKNKGTNGAPWDYSIAAIKRLAQDSDINIYLQFKKDEITKFLARTGYSDIKMPTKPTKKKGKKEPKKAAKKDKGSKGSKKSKKGKHEQPKSTEDIKPEIIVVQEPYIYNNQIELSKIINQLDKPTILNHERLKYFCCHRVMCSYFTQMCQLLDDLEVDMAINLPITYPPAKQKLVPIENYPSRMIYEHFDEDYVPRSLTSIPKYSLEPKPRPLKLNEIQPDNIEDLYTTYCNRPIPIKKTGEEVANKKKGKDKGKGNKAKSPKSSKKKDKSSSKGSAKSSKSDKKKTGKTKKEGQKVHPESPPVVFDPYCENFDFVEEIEEGPTFPANNDSVTDVPKGRNEEYKYRSYVIVRSCLNEAVDAVLDTVDMFECLVSYETINKVKNYFQEEVKTVEQ